MKLGPLIARGFTAEIYAWRNGWILKLFNQGISRQSVEYEANVSRIVHATSLPTPAVGEVIEMDSRFGLELERVEGLSMLETLARNSQAYVDYAHQLAELQAELHSYRVPELPDQRQQLRIKINHAAKLPEEVRSAAQKTLEELPEQDRLCHGDFHPGNILFSQHGPVIIDWIDATRGSPLLDVARSTLLFGDVRLPPDFPGAGHLNPILDSFYQEYIDRYFEINPLDLQELGNWLPVVAAARLDENIYYDEERLLSIAKRLLDV